MSMHSTEWLGRESYQATIPFLDEIVQGDCRHLLRQLPDECVDVVITSPPYYRQRDYGGMGMGNESSPQEYIENLLEVFEQCVRCTKRSEERRVGKEGKVRR